MARGFPRGIRSRGHKLQMLIKRAGRGWDWEATGLPIDQVAAAVKLRKTTQAIIDSGTEAEAHGRTTVDAYAKRWLADRKSRGLRSVEDDESRLRLHILSHEFGSGRRFGAMYVDEVRPLHARAIVRAAVDKGLAPRTVINVQSLGRQMFLDAVPDELITSSPWVVPKKELPKKRDKTPSWRAGAKYTLAELRMLLWATDDLVPWDRRIFYALMYFGAMRFGEASARRWSDRVDREPQRALHIHSAFSTSAGREQETKTEGVRLMPEHPTLTALLAAWRLEGWPRFYGRPATDTDLIVPSRRGGYRRKNHSLHKLHEDLDRLGLRKRRQHDLRRSFIGHAVDAGATRDRLRPGTHGMGTSVMELYDSPEWAACCEHVLRLKLEAPEVVELRAAVGATGQTGTSDGSGPQNGPLSKEGADSMSANFHGSHRTGDMMGTDFNSRRLHQQKPRRAVSDAVSAVVPATYQHARSLLDACGGDVEAAIEAIRRARRGGR